MIHPHLDRLHPAPFWKVFKNYTLSDFRGDLMSGLTVAIFAVPQGIAYAMLAEVPPIHGLYAAMVASIVATLWGSSPYVNTGPTNSASLLTATAMVSYAGTDNHMQMVFLFTLMVGLIRLSLGLFRLGQIIHFVPESAFLGFTMGVGSMIALGRLHFLLGIETSGYSWFPAATFEKLLRIHHSDPHAVAISAITLIIVFGLQKWGRRFPVALVAILAGVGYARWMPGCTVDLVGDVPTGLPGFKSPFFQGWMQAVPELFPGAIAVAMVGLIEAVSIGQTLAVRHRQHLNFNQELTGQGLGMIASSFFQGIPGSGSFSRSALIEECGGRTLVANLIFGLGTALALLLLPGLIAIIPKASLAGLLLYIGVKLLDPKRVKRLWRTSRMDVYIMLTTLAVTVLLKIEYGIFTGIVLGALMLLNQTRVLHLEELLPTPDGLFEDKPYTIGSEHEPSSLVALTVHGNLTYSVSHELLEQLNEVAKLQNPKIIVLRIRGMYSIDYSSWNAVFDFAESFHRAGGKLYITDIDESVRQTIHDARAHDWIPDDHLFVPSEQMMESFEAGLRQALEELVETDGLSGRWRDWYENPQLVSREQLRDIERFLSGEST